MSSLSSTLCGGLLRRRLCVLPTWRGWLLLSLVAGLLIVFLVRGALPFLAPNASIPGGVLVVDGWAPDTVLQESIAEFQRHPYRALLVTGGRIENGAPFAEHGNYADFGVRIIGRLGFSSAALHPVPVPDVRKDRTYAAALAVRSWLAVQSSDPALPVNVIAIGPHARRSHLLYREAFPEGRPVGVIAIPDRTFDPARWWTSSAGVRTVVGEAIAYVYARCLFRPDAS